MTSLALNPATWDLTLDNGGNLAIITGGNALAQDAACACRLFLGELYYDNTQGIPYFQNILGLLPPLSYVKAQLVAAAMTVVGVTAAAVYITGVNNRKLSGQVQVTDGSGVVFAASF